MSRETLVETYIMSLPFVPVAIVAVPGGGSRIEIGGTSAPTLYFKQSHLELVLGAAGLGRPIDQRPDAVAALIERTARSMQAPYDTGRDSGCRQERGRQDPREGRGDGPGRRIATA